MGYIRHDAIIVTAWDSERLARCVAKAAELGLCHTEIVGSKSNGYASFMIVPDGSKEGWPASDEGKTAREAWIFWARNTEELWADWVLVNYGGDEPEYTSIADHNGKEAGALENNRASATPEKML
jgi:hypothetical protein